MISQVWEYFLAIEQDLEKCTRFVHFSKQNYRTNSIEFARIILAAGSEFEAIAKEISTSIDSRRPAKNIANYCSIITEKYPKISHLEFEVPRYQLTFAPFKEWGVGDVPVWWKESYTPLKHDRLNKFQSATLENACLAVSALLGIILYYSVEVLKKEAKIESSLAPRLFVGHRGITVYGSGAILWSYKIPENSSDS